MADYSGPISSMMALVGEMYNAALQTETNEYNMENQWKLLGAQNARQDQLNINQALTQRQSLAKAGMNVNSEFGGSPSTTPPPASSATAVAPRLDTSSIVNLLLQAPLISAQVGKTKAEADEIRSRIPKNKAETNKIIADTANALEQNGILHFENETQKQRFELWQQSMYADIDYKEAQTSNINIDTRIKDFESQLFEATFDDRKQYYAELVNEIINRQDLQDAEKRQALASASKAYADASFTNAQEVRLRTLLHDELQKVRSEWYKNDQEGKKVGFEIDYLMAQTANIETHTQWIEFEEYCKSLGMGAGAISKFMKYTPLGRKIPKGRKR